jgi:hypothetical protein
LWPVAASVRTAVTAMGVGIVAEDVDGATVAATVSVSLSLRMQRLSAPQSSQYRSSIVRQSLSPKTCLLTVATYQNLVRVRREPMVAAAGVVVVAAVVAVDSARSLRRWLVRRRTMRPLNTKRRAKVPTTIPSIWTPPLHLSYQLNQTIQSLK